MIGLRIEALVHVYAVADIRAVDGVDLVIGAGERVAIVGQNGSGKSTLVSHLNGLLRPTEGLVLVDGVDAATVTVARLARRVGVVFQDPNRQMFARSVRAEVEFGPRNLGFAGQALKAAVEEALAAVGLEREAGTNPYDLGDARRKSLALASVLAMRTPVLVLDEPTTGLDARGTQRVREVIDTAHAAGRTVIAVSHDMPFVAETFDRLVVMGAGRIILDAPVDEVFAERQWPTLASTFLEPPLAARVGARLGLGSTPTDGAVVQALLASDPTSQGRAIEPGS